MRSSRLRERLATTRVNGDSLLPGPAPARDELGRSLSASSPRSDRADSTRTSIAQVIIEAKYDGYIGRQIEQIERFRRLEDKPIPQRPRLSGDRPAARRGTREVPAGAAPLAGSGRTDQRHQSRRHRHPCWSTSSDATCRCQSQAPRTRNDTTSVDRNADQELDDTNRSS